MNKSAPFKIPTIEQIADFMSKSMKDWPESFCKIYAEKFYHFYQARGWRLSRNVLMRDWHAAFFANWREVRFIEDQKTLERCYHDPVHRLAMQRRKDAEAGLFAGAEEGPKMSAFDCGMERVDMIFRAYSEGKAKPGQLRDCYDWLKAHGLMRLPKTEIDRIITEQGNDKDRGRLMAVSAWFALVVGSGLTPRQYIHSKLQKA